MTWDDLRKRLGAENCFTVTMGELRDIHGAGKLGPRVSTAIGKHLAQTGIGHVPRTLPVSQNDQVRLFLHGTRVGSLISMVLTAGETNDAKLIAHVEGGETDLADIVDQIRELVS